MTDKLMLTAGLLWRGDNGWRSNGLDLVDAVPRAVVMRASSAIMSLLWSPTFLNGVKLLADTAATILVLTPPYKD